MVVVLESNGYGVTVPPRRKAALQSRGIQGSPATPNDRWICVGKVLKESQVQIESKVRHTLV
jgi:hypothetical protein